MGGCGYSGTALAARCGAHRPRIFGSVFSAARPAIVLRRRAAPGADRRGAAVQPALPTARGLRMTALLSILRPALPHALSYMRAWGPWEWLLVAVVFSAPVVVRSAFRVR